MTSQKMDKLDSTVTGMLGNLDLSEYIRIDKKTQFEILKNINQKLETSFNGSLEELLAESIKAAGYEPKEDNIKVLSRTFKWYFDKSKNG